MKSHRLMLLVAPMLAVSRRYMSDPADSAATSGTVEPSKESILQRVEALIDAGYSEVKTVLHDLLTDVESVFKHQAPADDAAPADSADVPAATTGDAGNGVEPAAGAGTQSDAA